MGSTAAMTNAGLLSVANQSNITGTGTVTSGTWNSAGTITTASQPNFTTLAGLTAIGSSSSSITDSSSNISSAETTGHIFLSTTNNKPNIEIISRSDDAQAGHLVLTK